MAVGMVSGPPTGCRPPAGRARAVCVPCALPWQVVLPCARCSLRHHRHHALGRSRGGGGSGLGVEEGRQEGAGLLRSAHCGAGHRPAHAARRPPAGQGQHPSPPWLTMLAEQPLAEVRVAVVLLMTKMLPRHRPAGWDGQRCAHGGRQPWRSPRRSMACAGQPQPGSSHVAASALAWVGACPSGADGVGRDLRKQDHGGTGSMQTLCPGFTGSTQACQALP